MSETTSMHQPATSGYELTRFNALRHGVLSGHTVLPWEGENEYRELLNALVAVCQDPGRVRSWCSGCVLERC